MEIEYKCGFIGADKKIYNTKEEAEITFINEKLYKLDNNIILVLRRYTKNHSFYYPKEVLDLLKNNPNFIISCAKEYINLYDRKYQINPPKERLSIYERVKRLLK
jgi:hypothetical protein